MDFFDEEQLDDEQLDDELDDEQFADPTTQALFTVFEWLSEDNPREQRRFLEEHPELLEERTEWVLKLLLSIFNEQPEEFQRLTQLSEERVTEVFQKYKMMIELFATMAGGSGSLAQMYETSQDSLKALQAIRAGGGSFEAIRTAYVNLFGGLALDVPAWLDEGVRQIVEAQTAGQETADEWYMLIERAKKDPDVPPEFVAALWYERAVALMKDIDNSGADKIDEVIAAYEAALEIFTADRYPVQHAKFQTYLAQAYLKREDEDQQKRIEQAVQISEEALEALTVAGLTDAEVQVNLGLAHLARAEAQFSPTNAIQAIQYFQMALKFYNLAVFPEQWATCQLYLGIAYVLSHATENPEHLDLATKHFCAALEVYTREAFPDKWAEIHLYMGRAYMRTEREEDARKTLDHLSAALEIYTRERYPEQWAKAQTFLGDLYTEHFGKGNFEVARSYYEAALEVLTPEKYPDLWALCCHSLADLYGNHFEERDSTQREKAIQYSEAALQVYKRETHPQVWANIQTNLAMAYSNRIEGDHYENLQHALSCCLSALEVFGHDTSSTEKAHAENVLAVIYGELGEDEATNIERGIATGEDALQLLTRSEYPQEWASVRLNLGTLYMRRKEGITSTNLERAIQHFLAAQQVFTRNAYPLKWALIQRNLSLVYSLRVEGEKADNIERAISYNKMIEEIYTQNEFPYEWALTQMALAHLYDLRIWGDKQENQEEALRACELALSELSRDLHPSQWASVQRTLGDIYKERLTGNSTENLMNAIIYYEAALQVYSLEASPDDYRLIQLSLAQIRGRQGNWQVVHKAYVQARKAEDELIRLGAGLKGQHLAIGHWGDARDAGPRDGFALIRLGRVEEGIVAIERGQARIMTASLTMDAADPMQISNVERREHYIQARQAYIEAQAALNAPQPSQVLEYGRQEVEQKLWSENMARRNTFRVAQARLEEVIKEIRAADDPANFLDDTLDVQTILQVVERGGEGHALVYLMATPWGGMAVAAFSANPHRHTHARIAAFDLPNLQDKTISRLLSVRLTEEAKPIIGGFSYAQQHQGFGLLFRDWPGESFLGWAENLNDACFREGKVGMLDQAAQEILQDSRVAHLVTQPLGSLKWNNAAPLMAMMDERFLRLELQRVLKTLAEAGIPQLVDWLVEQGATSLTFVPCGWLATLPIVAVQCAAGRTVGEVLPTTVAPNARSLLESNGTNKAQRSGIYTFGNPQPTKHPLLLWGEAEAVTIAKLARALKLHAETKIGRDAKREKLVHALEHGYIVDASCHGRFDNHDFLHSALLLANNQELTLGDMLSHKVDLRGLRLLILSACQTASAEMVGAAANELKSLAAGMLQAGADAVLASLWPVDDHATYVLMVRFAQEWLPRMESEPPALALARAQRWMRTVTNKELQQWQVTELPPITQEEKREVGAVASENMIQPLTETDSNLTEFVGQATRSYRYEMGEAQARLRAVAKQSDPEAHPFADPIYWAGFQVTGW